VRSPDDVYRGINTSFVGISFVNIQIARELEVHLDVSLCSGSLDVLLLSWC
jgi:hypothetical protein